MKLPLFLKNNTFSSIDPNLGGLGRVIDHEGQVLGVKSPKEPFLTVEIDLDLADEAKQTYPRYLPD